MSARFNPGDVLTMTCPHCRDRGHVILAAPDGHGEWGFVADWGSAHHQRGAPAPSMVERVEVDQAVRAFRARERVQPRGPHPREPQTHPRIDVGRLAVWGNSGVVTARCECGAGCD